VVSGGVGVVGSVAGLVAGLVAFTGAAGAPVVAGGVGAVGALVDCGETSNRSVGSAGGAGGVALLTGVVEGAPVVTGWELIITFDGVAGLVVSGVCAKIDAVAQQTRIGVERMRASMWP